MQTLIDATEKETATDQQQHSCETLICQRHQTIIRLLSSSATARTRGGEFATFIVSPLTFQNSSEPVPSKNPKFVASQAETKSNQRDKKTVKS